jgi:hypothetical protein
MNFIVEKLALTDSRGRSTWTHTAAPQVFCKADGTDAGALLALLVAEDGGVPVGVNAALLNGGAMTVATKGATLYALRAIPMS